jgi:UDPglucose 6-dehydrogenase
LIGESDGAAGQILEDIYKRSTDSDPEIHRMNFVNAELTKISINTFLTTKISYANMIGEMCDHLPGADADIVNFAVGADSRIGRKYLKSATGYGGPCFPRDNKAFTALGRKLGVRCDLAEATDHINDHQLARLRHAVETSASPGQIIAILGLSYKSDTNVIEESQGVMLAKLLADQGYKVVVFDPLASGNAHVILGSRAVVAPSAPAAINGADVVVIATPWKQFAALRPDDVSKGGRPRTIIDPWRVLPAETAAQRARYVVLGKGAEDIPEGGHEVRKASAG